MARLVFMLGLMLACAACQFTLVHIERTEYGTPTPRPTPCEVK